MKILFAVVFLLIFSNLFGQTTISGKVSGTWTKDKSPYIVTGNINLLSTESLTIDPGVKVIFQGHYKFDVEGQLLALGNQTDSILFTVKDTVGFSNPAIANGSWDGININQASPKNILISHCIFEFAKGLDIDAGGAIQIKKLGAPIEILNSAFRKNISNSGGALFYDGFSTGYSSMITIKNCHFINNLAKSQGGAIRFNGFGGLKELSNCTFLNNKAGSAGGAISIQASKIFNCLFKNNSANSYGGAVYNVGSTSLNIYNSIFNHNSSAVGGAYYANMGVYSGLYNCTFTNNISNHSIIYTGTNLVVEFAIVNSIVWNPGSPEIILSSATTRKKVANSIIRNAKDSAWYSATCLDVNPLLSADENFPYSPMEGSPCIDKGNNSDTDPSVLVDFYNKCRIWDGKNTGSKTVDIGAVEFNSVDSIPKLQNDLNDTILCEGAPLSLSLITLDKEANYNFQWFRNNESLTATSSTYSIDHVTTNHSGYYFCRINNKYGVIQSKAVYIQVEKIPVKPSKPFGTEDSITNLTDTSVYKIPTIINSATIEWELLPSEAGEISFNDTMAVVKWDSNFKENSSLVVKHSNENCFSLSDTLQLKVNRDPNYVLNPAVYLPNIYPNPSPGTFFVDFKGLEFKDLELTICDFIGRAIWKESILDTKSIKKYTLPHGGYLITLRSENKPLITFKIIIN